jgi:hypothetical protein
MLFKPNPTCLTSAYACRHLKQVPCSPRCIRVCRYMHWLDGFWNCILRIHTHTHTQPCKDALHSSSSLEVNSIYLWNSAIPLVLDSKRTSHLVVFESTNDGSRETATCNGSSWRRPSALGTSNVIPLFKESAVYAPNLTISAHSILVASRPGSLLFNIGYVLFLQVRAENHAPNNSCVYGSISKRTK